MQHSIAAKYAARPAARFVRPSHRARERRLGLRPSGTFNAAVPHATVLRRADLGPFVQLRASWRAVRATRPQRPSAGLLTPAVRMRWTRFDPASDGRRASAAPAPWRD
jgi:hypothetical protein